LVPAREKAGLGLTADELGRVVGRFVEGDGRHQVIRGRLDGDRSMDDLKRTSRNVTTSVKKTARGLDGTDFNDQVGNAGDEIRKDLGNLGDDIREARREQVGPRDHPAARPKQTV
jgi:hypothetical protein